VHSTPPRCAREVSPAPLHARGPPAAGPHSPAAPPGRSACLRVGGGHIAAFARRQAICLAAVHRGMAQLGGEEEEMEEGKHAGKVKEA
jgi:hypothetical protein